MRKLFFPLFILLPLLSLAQPDSTKWLRAFPVTDYMIDLNDSFRLVQVQLPDATALQEKQLGVIRGVYRTSRADTVQKGYGRCHLIKGDYYYFSIGHLNSDALIREGDLLYTMVKQPAVYNGQLLKLASHFITLQNVYETALYDPYRVFHQWEKTDETALVDSLVADIQFTGNYFKENNPSMDVPVSKGRFSGQKTFTVMMECSPAYVIDFLDYMIVRPRLYAGREWKISEIFATWVSEGAPTVVKDE
jgi:hypothetical protein